MQDEGSFYSSSLKAFQNESQVGCFCMQNRTFRSGRFVHGTFQSWSFRSRDISVRLWHLAEIMHMLTF